MERFDYWTNILFWSLIPLFVFTGLYIVGDVVSSDLKKRDEIDSQLNQYRNSIVLISSDNNQTRCEVMSDFENPKYTRIIFNGKQLLCVKKKKQEMK